MRFLGRKWQKINRGQPKLPLFCVLRDIGLSLERVLQEKADAAVSCGGWREIVESILRVTGGYGLIAGGDESQDRDSGVGVIEEVEHLGTEVEGLAFVDREVALDGDITSKDSGGIAIVSANGIGLRIFGSVVEVHLIESYDMAEIIVRPPGCSIFSESIVHVSPVTIDVR
jgi:hypothetical protein